jgi:hypothetical protein
MPISTKTRPHPPDQLLRRLPTHPILPVIFPYRVGRTNHSPNCLSVAHEHISYITEVFRPVPVQSVGVCCVERIVATIEIHIRMPCSNAYRVSLQPPCSAGVVLARADVVQPCEGDILVPIRAVPQKRLLGDGSPYRQIATNPCKLLESCMPQPDPAHQGRNVSGYLSVQIRCDEYRELSHQSPSL